MKILLIVNKDGPNLFIENIVKQFIMRSHEVCLYAMFDDDTSIRMFKNMGLYINKIDDLNKEIIKSVDCIFCPIQALSVVKFASKFIFSFCNMNPKFDEVRGADFVFTLSQVEERKIKAFSTMPIGLPKNDTPVIQREENSKRILVVDSGHFPFSKIGKKQIAHMIIDICAKFPQYEICVKPRWLRDCDTTAMTHVNKEHLYDVIEEICNNELPDNLLLLQEHIDLQELIDSSESVVTLCTTAYLDVALRGKGLVIASGITNEDMYQVRSDYFDRVYNYAEKSGCVVNYKEVCNYLPKGIKCKETHLSETFTYLDNVSNRVVEVMEYVMSEIIMHNSFPMIADYSYETYKDVMVADPNVSITKLKGNRMYVLAGGVIALCRSISPNIDWTPFLEYQYKLCKKSEKNDVAFAKVKRKLKTAKYKYMIENKEKLFDNSVDRGFLYEAYFYLEDYKMLFERQKIENKQNSSLNYFCGLALCKKRKYKEAKSCLELYLNETNNREYQKYLVDRENYKKDVYYNLMDCYRSCREYEKEWEMYCLCSDKGYFNSNSVNYDKILRRVLPSLIRKAKNRDEENIVDLKEHLKNVKNRIRDRKRN